MNNLAHELNRRLEGTVALDLLSDFGRRFFFPKGIAAQSAEATAKASRYNATIGMAFEAGEPMMLPSLRSYLTDLGPRDAVAYAPNAGDAKLRSAWKELIRKKNPDIGATRFGTPTVVTGLTNGIAHIADLFADPDDTVIVPDMFWGNYRLIFESRNRARLDSFPFYSDSGGFNLAGFSEALERSSGQGKAIVMLNFPNNPTGYTPSYAEVDGIVAALEAAAKSGTDLLVISDDAYFGLFYEKDTYPQSLFARLAGLHPRILAVKIDGATKEEFVWGFRIGFITFGSPGMNDDQLEALEKKLLGAIRSSISNSSRLSQSLLMKTLASPTYEAEKQHYFDLLASRYRKVREVVSERPDDVLAPLPFNSGYFMSFRVISNRAEELRQKLLDERQIGTIAIGDSFLRVAYSAVDEETIEPLYSEIYEMAATLA